MIDYSIVKDNKNNNKIIFYCSCYKVVNFIKLLLSTSLLSEYVELTTELSSCIITISYKTFEFDVFESFIKYYIDKYVELEEMYKMKYEEVKNYGE